MTLKTIVWPMSHWLHFSILLVYNVSKPVRTTHSSTKILLVVPKIALNRYSKCTFKMGAAILWNSITDEHLNQSNDATTFKKRLKKYLFNGNV